MKVGEIKRDINVKLGTAKTLFGDYTERALIKEGIRLFDKHPKYRYLKDDPWNEKDPERIYRSFIYAYMADYILKEHPEFNNEYKRIVEKIINQWKDGNDAVNIHADKAYCFFNGVVSVLTI